MCEYKNTIKHLDEGRFQCGADENYECPEGEYQSRVVITVVGDLRDRMKQETHMEWNAFNNCIAKKIRGKSCFDIKNCSCRIRGWQLYHEMSFIWH